MLNFKKYQRTALLRMLRLQPQSQSTLSTTSSSQPSQQFHPSTSSSTPIALPSSSSQFQQNPTTSSNFHSTLSTTTNQWKVLIYDTLCRSIIAPQLTLHQLKSESITLHLSITQPREIIKNVPIIYFLRPTEQNLTLIINDLNRQLYDTIYINFTTIPPGFLERMASRFANECIHNSPVFQKNNPNGPTLENIIREVNNLMIDFVCTEDNCISLSHNFSYLCLFSSLLGQTQIIKYIEKISNSILSLIFQIYQHHGSLPYFYVSQSQNTPSNMVLKYVCQHLPTMLSNLHNQANFGLQSATSLLSSLSQVHYSKRWKLVLLDRNLTLGSQFLQSIQYLSLVYDLGFKHGHVSLPLPPSDSSSSSNPNNQQGNSTNQHGKEKMLLNFQNVDVDANDVLWIANRYKILPDVAETIHHTNIKYKNEIARINGLMTNSASQQNSSSASNQLQGLSTSDYNAIITTLPILTKKKTQLDAHTTICTTLVQTTGQRQLHKLYPNELSLLSTHFKTLFKPGIGISGTTGVEGVNINPQTQQPVIFDDVLKTLQTADTLALKNLSNPQTHQQVQQTQNQFTGSVSPLDRLRLLCLSILTGLNTSNQNSTFTTLVNNLKRTCNDSRYYTHFHTSSNQIELMVNFCISTLSTVSMQLKSQSILNTNGAPQQLTAQSGANKAMSFLTSSAQLFVSQQHHTPLHQICSDPSQFSTINTSSQSQQGVNSTSPYGNNQAQSNNNNQQQQSDPAFNNKHQPLMLIDPLIMIQSQLQNTSSNHNFNSQQQQQLPTAQQLQSLETLVFVIGSGNYTEYINLCGEYCNYLYYTDPNSDVMGQNVLNKNASNFQPSQSSFSSLLPGSSVSSYGSIGQSGIVGYDDDVAVKEQFGEKMKTGKLPKGLVYGCTEVTSLSDFMQMVCIITLLNKANMAGFGGQSSQNNSMNSGNVNIGQLLSTKLNGILALVGNGTLPSSQNQNTNQNMNNNHNNGGNNSTQNMISPGFQLYQLQNEFTQLFQQLNQQLNSSSTTTSPLNDTNTSNQNNNVYDPTIITPQTIQSILTALELSQQ